MPFPTPALTEQRITTKLRSAISIQENTILLALRISGITSKASPGEILQAMVAFPSVKVVDLLREASRAKLAFRAAVKEVKQELASAVQAGQDLIAAADFISGEKDDLPDSMGDELKQLSRVTRAGVLNGLVDPGLAGLLKKRANTGLLKLKDLDDRINRMSSAGRVARLSATKKLLDRAFECEEFSERGKARLFSHKYQALLDSTKRKHSKTFFQKRT